GDDVLCFHAEFNDLEGDATADRFLLLGHIDDATASFANLLEHLVAADSIARLLGYSHHARRQDEGLGGDDCGRLIEETAGVFVRLEQGFDTLTKLFIAPTRAFDKSGPLLGRGKLQRGLEYLLFALMVVVHGGFQVFYHTMRNCGSKRISNFGEAVTLRLALHRDTGDGFVSYRWCGERSLGSVGMSEMRMALPHRARNGEKKDPT